MMGKRESYSAAFRILAIQGSRYGPPFWMCVIFPRRAISREATRGLPYSLRMRYNASIRCIFGGKETIRSPR